MGSSGATQHADARQPGPHALRLPTCTPFQPPLQEEGPLDLGTLGQEVAAQPTEEGSTFRVYRCQLSTADPKLKVGALQGRPGLAGRGRR